MVLQKRAPSVAAVAALGLVLGMAGQVNAALLLDITSGANGGSAADQTIGYAFTLTQGQAVTALGIWDQGANGLGQSHEVGIWDSIGTTLLGSATVSDASSTSSVTNNGGRWMFTSVPSFNLASGSYLVGAFYADGSPDRYRVFASPPTMASGATFGNARVAFGSFSAPTQPQPILDPAYFGPNVQISAAQVAAVPEPSTYAMFGLGLLAIAALSRRKKHQQLAFAPIAG